MKKDELELAESEKERKEQVKYVQNILLMIIFTTVVLYYIIQ